MRANSNVAMLFSLMHRICQVMGEYFKEVEEESIRDNFVICYELLDELVDFGYPQTTDAKILQEYITQVGRFFTILFIPIKIQYNPVCDLVPELRGMCEDLICWRFIFYSSSTVRVRQTAQRSDKDYF